MESFMFVTKIIDNVCKENRNAKKIDDNSFRVGSNAIRVYDNGGIYDVTRFGLKFTDVPQTKRNVFAPELGDVIRNFI
jgi:hypothetical protein